MISKRKLLTLVNEGVVDGWDDPRMPTLSGYRRRGYTPEAIRDMVAKVGVAKSNSTAEIALLEHCLRVDLNQRAPRRMAVLDPLRVVITNYPEGDGEMLDAINNPEDDSMGTRQIPFSKVIYIEREDFMEDPPKKFYRLAPGREVRLRYAYFIKCEEVIKDDSGEVIELRCSYDPATRGGESPPDGRKVRATLHWVSASHAVNGEARLYDHLFSTEDPLEVEKGDDWKDNLNPNSKIVKEGVKLEPSLKNVRPFEFFQFERKGYFSVDPDSTSEHPVFNRSVTLRDTWERIKKSQKK